MIDFQRISPADKPDYDAVAAKAGSLGCEYAFANLYGWGLQQLALRHGCIMLFSHFRGHTVYPCPVGPGDRKQCIEDIIADARQRGIPCRITSIREADVQTIEGWFPGVFQFRCDREGFDYVYDIDDLADLKGRKFQKKRNHVNAFRKLHPDWRTEPLSGENLPVARQLVADWYNRRRQTDPQGDYLLESVAINRVFRHYGALDMEGILLYSGDTPIAVTLGSRLGADIFDIHFEKALDESAYAAINQEFARYLREKYPQVRYLDREDDMGLEGLRKAKLSYNPVRMTEKYWAYLSEDCFPEESAYED